MFNFKSVKILLFISIVFFANLYSQNTDSTFLIDVNNISIPIDNKGVLAHVEMANNYGRYDNGIFLFSGGFYLSGISNDTIWSNGVATASLLNDYLPGKVNSNPIDSLNKIYVVKSDDPAFSESWQNWKNAVSLGAEFHDGDNNGIYNPVDKNSNGKWDSDEDKPMLIGDVTAWTVYNDGTDPSMRRYPDVSPKGIEIHQTVFASRGSGNEAMQNTIFIKYKIINTGNIDEKFDSVYFGAWTDPDLGNYTDDLSGTDTLLKSIYVYNDGNDEEYGSNSPAFFTSFLQGPAEFIAGETFTDQNNNGIFDLGIDVPLDTAYYFNASTFTKEEIIGAKNIDIVSSNFYMAATPTQEDPFTKIEARNYLRGLNKVGNKIDPCTFPFGAVRGGVDCSAINSRFITSGDPVANTGWIHTTPQDVRRMINIGAFTLEKEKPAEILVAYVVGRGTDALNSITVARNYVREAFDVYENNFTDFPVNVENENNIVPKEFVLNQNYPNPFNPNTAISYQLSAQSKVELKIFDVLGREVQTLVNEIQNAGNYKVNFNAANLPSGVYIYQIKADNFIQSKKMMLVK